MNNDNSLGIVTGGNIEAITVTLDRDIDLGAFVVVDGEIQYWGTVTDISHPNLPPDIVLASGMSPPTKTIATVDLKRMARTGEMPIPVKRLPRLGSSLRGAHASDIERLFGPQAPPNWVMGAMGGDHNLPLNLERLIKRLSVSLVRLGQANPSRFESY